MADSKLSQETRSISYSGVFYVPSHCNCFKFYKQTLQEKKKKKKGTLTKGRFSHRKRQVLLRGMFWKLGFETQDRESCIGTFMEQVYHFLYLGNWYLYKKKKLMGPSEFHLSFRHHEEMLVRSQYKKDVKRSGCHESRK